MNLQLNSLPTEDELKLSGDEIRLIRLRLGLSQEQFSRKIGVGRTSVWAWETGKTTPSPLAWEKLLDMLYRLKKNRKRIQALKYF